MLETYKNDLKGRKSIEESILARYGMNEPVPQFRHAGKCVRCSYLSTCPSTDPGFSRRRPDDRKE